MSTSTPAVRKFTNADISLAAAYYPILVEQARKRETITYGELIKQAKALHPDNPDVQAAIAVSVARKLDAISACTNHKGLPDLTSLVVNGTTGECGRSFANHPDAESARAEAYAYDWSGTPAEFDAALAATLAAPASARPRKQPTPRLLPEFDAAQQLYLYCKQTEPKLMLNPEVQERKDELVALIRRGSTPEAALNELMPSR